MRMDIGTKTRVVAGTGLGGINRNNDHNTGNPKNGSSRDTLEKARLKIRYAADANLGDNFT